MITAIRELRRERGLTLAQVAARCDPPTTAQSIGRLETGTRTVSVAWLNRIAAALEVTAVDLVRLPDRTELPVAAELDAAGARAPRQAATVQPPAAAAGGVAISVRGGIGDYRAGDVIWCEPIEPAAFDRALNRDVLVPRGTGRFAFGRLIDRDGARLRLMPAGLGARQQVIADAPWLALATRLIRGL